LDPLARNANLAVSFGSRLFGESAELDPLKAGGVMGEELARAAKGDLSLVTRILAAQAMSLDTIFTELARRSSEHLSDHPQAADRYMRLALKAQSNGRAALEALVKLHQPREQIVKHVHVGEGAQAVVADEFHHHVGGASDVEESKQSHALRPADSAMLSSDQTRHAVPISDGQRQKQVSHARRDKPRAASG
jgi:hypothetical protein